MPGDSSLLLEGFPGISHFGMPNCQCVLLTADDEELSSVKHVLPQDSVDELVANLFKRLGDEQKNAEKKAKSKIVDPLSVAIDLNTFGHDFDWNSLQIEEALRKARSMALGDFHQQLIGLIPGWEVMPQKGGYPDLVNSERKIIVELKARRNTVKGSDLVGVYENLLNWVNRGYEGYLGVFGYILPASKKHLSEPKLFVPSDAKSKQRKQPDKRIVEMDGYILWALITDSRKGIPNAPYENPSALIDVWNQVWNAIGRQGSKPFDSAIELELAKIARGSIGLK